METVKEKKLIARPVKANPQQTPPRTATVVRPNGATINNRPVFISVRDVQKLYLPMLSLKRIRKIVTLHVHTIKVGNKFLVNREQIEKLLTNPDIKIL